MSLDVYLRMNGALVEKAGKIFVREDGGNREISRAEWDEKFPGREPVIMAESELGEVYEANITHNLGKMADEAGVYYAMWRPEEIKCTKAGDLIEILEAGYELLKSDPVRFSAFNPDNGWGNYDGLLKFVGNYLEACKQYPNAEIHVSR